MRIIFVGTSEFALPVLREISTGDWDIVLAVCQPDRAKGRRGTPIPPPVKEMAENIRIPVFQPEKIKSEDSLKYLASLKPDIMITASYGQILSQKILDIPRFGCFNVHASFLPAYRGASPIRWSIINGDKKTGVTLFKMEEGMDTGDISLSEELIIEENESHQSLHDRLANVGAKLAYRLLEDISHGREISLTPQEEERVTYAPILKKEDGCIDWSSSSDEIERRIRGLAPWPGTYTFINGKNIKILAGNPVNKPPHVKTDILGTLYLLDKQRGIGVVCGKGCLELTTLKPENRKEQTSKQFLTGCRGNVEGMFFSSTKE